MPTNKLDRCWARLCRWLQPAASRPTFYILAIWTWQHKHTHYNSAVLYEFTPANAPYSKSSAFSLFSIARFTGFQLSPPNKNVIPSREILVVCRLASYSKSILFPFFFFADLIIQKREKTRRRGHQFRFLIYIHWRLISRTAIKFSGQLHIYIARNNTDRQSGLRDYIWKLREIVIARVNSANSSLGK